MFFAVMLMHDDQTIRERKRLTRMKKKLMLSLHSEYLGFREKFC